MACITKSNSDNFLTFNRVTGSITLAELQANGILACTYVELTAPTNFTAVSLSSSSAQLDWVSVVNSTSYEVFQSSSELGDYALVGSTSGITLDITGLLPLTTYFFKVRALNSTTQSVFSSVYSVTTDTVEAPSGVLTPDIQYESIQLFWVSNSNGAETGFRIERSPTGSGDWEEIGTTATNIVVFTDTSLLHNTTYYYRVYATSAMGDSAASSTVSATTTQMEAPTSLSLASDFYYQVFSSWVSSTDSFEEGFEIYASPDNSSFSLRGTTTTNILTFEDNKLIGDLLVYYKIRAFKGVNRGAFSSVESITTATATLSLVNDNSDALIDDNLDTIVMGQTTYNLVDDDLSPLINDNLDNITEEI